MEEEERRKKGETGRERGRAKRRRRNRGYFFLRNATICFLVFQVVLSGMTDFRREQSFGSAIVLCHKRQLELMLLMMMMMELDSCTFVTQHCYIFREKGNEEYYAI